MHHTWQRGGKEKVQEGWAAVDGMTKLRAKLLWANLQIAQEAEEVVLRAHPKQLPKSWRQQWNRQNPRASTGAHLTCKIYFPFPPIMSTAALWALLGVCDPDAQATIAH